MMGHTKLGAYHKVMQLYDQAIESNTQLDGGVYSLAMLSALNCGSFNTVKRIAEKAHDEQIELTEASYTILIQALAELNEFEAAVKCLDDMAAEGLSPNTITYSAVIAASKDHPQVVMQLLDRMERANVTKNTVVLTAAINSLARSGEAYVSVAFAILESMETNGPEPNIYTYNTITRALAESGLLNEALALVERVRRKGLKPDRFTLTTLLIACGRTKNSDMVSRVIEAMALAGVPPDGIAFGAALDAHRRAENALGAVECLSQMAQYRVEPTASHYNLVVRSLKAQGFTDRMFKMVLGISQKETARSKINSNTFEIVIESMLEVDKWKEAMILVQTMEKLDFKPSVQICVALVEKLERARQFKSVMAMYKLMVRYEYDFYENGVLNLIFKRMITVATMDLDMKLGLQDIIQKIKARK
jgi:pentatricopeptide repeat protein